MEGRGKGGIPVAKIVTLGSVAFIWVKLRPLELVKTNGLLS